MVIESRNQAAFKHDITASSIIGGVLDSFQFYINPKKISTKYRQILGNATCGLAHAIQLYFFQIFGHEAAHGRDFM